MEDFIEIVKAAHLNGNIEQGREDLILLIRLLFEPSHLDVRSLHESLQHLDQDKRQQTDALQLQQLPDIDHHLGMTEPGQADAAGHRERE